MEESNNMKIKDYFKAAENVIENNLKIFMPCMLIYIILNVGFTAFSMSINNSYNISNNISISNSGAIQLADEAQAASFVLITSAALLVSGLLFTLLRVFILIKTNTGLDFVENKRVNGSVVKKFGRLILVSLIFSISLGVIAGILSTISMVLFFINNVLGIFITMLMVIPISALSLLTIIAMYSLTFEIIVKNTRVIESFKAAYKNIIKSKNKTLSKMLVGIGVQILVFIVIQMFNEASYSIAQSYTMLVITSALQAAYTVYFLMYYFIVYMSSEV